MPSRSLPLLALALTVLFMPSLPERSAAEERPLSKRKRIALCSKKMNAPLDSSEPQPLRLTVEEEMSRKETFTRPEVLRQVNPVLSGPLVPGVVVMTGVIDEDGCVREPKVLQGIDSSMDAAALESFKQFVFLPATLDGKPIGFHYHLTTNFK